MVTAYIALGSNLGDRHKNIRDALDLLNKSGKVLVVKTSTLYETEPVGGPEQPDYVNGAAKINTALKPRELLLLLNDIETRLGRVRIEKNGPRTIDLDILLYENEVIDDPVLVVPHPRMHERAFVLKGLCEIAPELDVCVKFRK